MLSQNEMQLHLVLQLVNSQWSSYQDTMKKNNKNKMHNPSLEGLYQTLTKQQEIIYKQRENMILLKNRIGLRDDARKQKIQHSNVQMESLSDSLISMSLADQVQNERSKFTDKKLKNLKNILTARVVVVIKPQRPERLGLNSEIILEKRNRIIRTLNTTSKVAPTPTILSKNGPARVPHIPVVGQQQTKVSIGASASSSLQQSNSFGSSALPPPLQTIPFGASKKEDAPKFSISTGAQQAFGGFNAPTVQKPMIVSGLAANQPFQTTPAPLAFDLGKRKEASTANTNSVVPQSISVVPQQEPLKLTTAKPSTTIANANIAVSATFSIPLSNKVTSTASSKDPKVTEKKIEEANPSPDNASYTFKVAEKKDSVVTLKAPLATALVGFGFNSSGNSTFSFGGSSFGKEPETGAPAVVTSTLGFSGFGGATSFTGFGSKTGSEGLGAQSSSSTTGTSVLGGQPSSATTGTSVFGSSTTPAFGGFGGGSSTGFGLNLKENDNPPKPATTTSGSDSFSFVSSLTTTASDAKTTTQQPTKQTVNSSAVTSTFSLGQTTISTVPATTSDIQTPPTASTFSFANFGISSSTPTVTSALAAALKPDSEKPTATNSTTDTVLQALNICSPESISKSVTQSPSASSIFGSASTFNTVTNTDSSSSIFGGSATITKIDSSLNFGTALNLTPSSIAQTSIFGATTQSATSPSLFGALNLSSNADANKVTATSPPSGLFSSLVKPDQSVFGGSATVVPAISSPFGGAVVTSAPAAGSPFGGLASTGAPATGSPFGGSVTSTAPAATSPFGGIFANANNSGQSSVFGGAATNNSGSIFGVALTTQNSVFGGAAAFGSTATTTSSVFGSSTGGSSVFPNNNTTAPTGSSIFGGFGNAQPTNTGSIFGGNGTASTTTPFGGSSVFGGSPAAPQQSTFGSSVFGAGNANTR